MEHFYLLQMNDNYWVIWSLTNINKIKFISFNNLVLKWLLLH